MALGNIATVAAAFTRSVSPGKATSKVRLVRFPSKTDTTVEDAFFRAHLEKAPEDDIPKLREQEVQIEIESVYEEIRLHNISKPSTAGSESTSTARQMRRIAALQAELGRRKQAIATLRDSMKHEDLAQNFTEERAMTLGMLGSLYEEAGCLFGEERPSRRILLLRRSKEFYQKQLEVLELLKGSESYEVAISWYKVGRVHRMLHEPKWKDDFDTAIRLVLARGVEEFPSSVIDTLADYNSQAMATFKASPSGLLGYLDEAPPVPRRQGPQYGSGSHLGRPAGDDSLPSSSASSSEDDGIVMPVLGRIRLNHQGGDRGGTDGGGGPRAGSSKARPKVKVASGSGSREIAARKRVSTTASCGPLSSDCADCP